MSGWTLWIVAKTKPPPGARRATRSRTSRRMSSTDPNGSDSEALAPIAGTVVKLHPHAFVVVGEDGTGILVHLGIDTVELAGDGFELMIAERDVVSAGQPVTRWDPAAVAARGMSPAVMICVLDSKAGSVSSPAIGTTVAAGDPVFDWPGWGAA